MTNGLVVLIGWVGLAAMVALLAFFLLRRR